MSLQVKNLTKTFGEKLAVDNISFEMSEPGVFGLIGTNGNMIGSKFIDTERTTPEANVLQE